MHIEPGLVDASKIFLSYATGAAALGYSARLALDMLRKEGAGALLLQGDWESALAVCLQGAQDAVRNAAQQGLQEAAIEVGVQLGWQGNG